MKPIRFKLLAFLLLGFSLAGLNAQEAIPATGGEANGSGGTVSYTVGQLLYHTQSANSGTVAQGVQQPFEILELTGVGSMAGINLH
ncbi:MAG: hypothetical protein KAT15_14025, partial [Bacteroidales bacterium]|nr:hypothetical protein [Bacteroidales bacterium]